MEVARLLLERGADPSGKDHLGTTAITRAKLQRNGDILALLEARPGRLPKALPATTRRKGGSEKTK
jgi:ankyrin repeat protein